MTKITMHEGLDYIYLFSEEFADDSQPFAEVPTREVGELIVRAVNAHDDLLAACKTARTLLHHMASTGPPMADTNVVEAWRVLDAAIEGVEA